MEGPGIFHAVWLTTVTLEGPLIVKPEGPVPVKVKPAGLLVPENDTVSPAFVTAPV